MRLEIKGGPDSQDIAGTLIEPVEWGVGTPEFIARRLEVQLSPHSWFLKWGQSCGTEPFTCGVGATSA